MIQIEKKLTQIQHPDFPQGVSHGHPHYGNMTVEFIRKPYYNKHMTEDGNVNTIPFEVTQFTFDMPTYMQAPTEWVPVVRLIDWDQSKSFQQAA